MASWLRLDSNAPRLNPEYYLDGKWIEGPLLYRPLKFECPNCTQHLAVDDGMAGQMISCPTCGKSVTLPQSISSPLSEARSLPPPLPPALLPSNSPTTPPPITEGARQSESALRITRPPVSQAATQALTETGTPSDPQRWETQRAGSGKAAFLATPRRGEAYRVAVGQEEKSRAALYSGCSFLVLVFFLKGGFYGGLAMLILVVIFLGFVKGIELLTAKHFARKMEALRKASLNPSNLGPGFDLCSSPSCDVCRAPMEAPQGHLLTTSQIVNSAAFWARYWKIHEPSIKAIGKAQGMNFVPSYRLFAYQYDKMKQLHFIFERIADHAEPWLVCAECLKCFEIDRKESAALAEVWWNSGGKFSPAEGGPADYSDIDLGGFKAQFQIVGSMTLMVVGATLFLVAFMLLFSPPSGGGGSHSPVIGAAICFLIGASLVLGGRKLWKG